MQSCSLIKKNRKRGPDVWLLRWSDKSVSGKRIYRKRVIGTVEEFPDADSAHRAVVSLIEGLTRTIPESAFARPQCRRSVATSNDASWHKEIPGAATPRR